MNTPLTKSTTNVDTTVISEDISSLLRAARAEVLYPGNNGTNPVEIAAQLEILADSIDHTRLFDDLDTSITHDYIKTNSTMLRAVHPNILVRKLAGYITNYLVTKK